MEGPGWNPPPVTGVCDVSCSCGCCGLHVAAAQDVARHGAVSARCSGRRRGQAGSACAARALDPEGARRGGGRRTGQLLMLGVGGGG